jgi:hypothetical protein
MFDSIRTYGYESALDITINRLHVNFEERFEVARRQEIRQGLGVREYWRAKVHGEPRRELVRGGLFDERPVTHESGTLSFFGLGSIPSRRHGTDYKSSVTDI